MQTGPDHLARSEWRLWFSASITTLLAGVVLLLSAFRSLFAHTDRFYEITAPQARLAAFEFLLLFNIWMVYRQWSFRRAGRELRAHQHPNEASAGAPSDAAGSALQDSFRLDPATGLCTRASFEHLLGKEVARSRRRKSSLSLVAIQLDDFAQFAQRFGASAADTVVKEFASRLLRASRGADFAVRLEFDAFLLALPDCGLTDAKRVLDRLGDLDMEVSGKDVTLTHSLGWIDYKPGEVPSDLIRRAEQVLHLYGKAASDTVTRKRK
jgi:diguanylate cyclase (GGDEF)-like protein